MRKANSALVHKNLTVKGNQTGDKPDMAEKGWTELGGKRACWQISGADQRKGEETDAGKCRILV